MGGEEASKLLVASNRVTPLQCSPGPGLGWVWYGRAGQAGATPEPPYCPALSHHPPHTDILHKLPATIAAWFGHHLHLPYANYCVVKCHKSLYDRSSVRIMIIKSIDVRTWNCKLITQYILCTIDQKFRKSTHSWQCTGENNFDQFAIKRRLLLLAHTASSFKNSIPSIL